MNYPPLVERELDCFVFNSELLVAVHVTSKCCNVSARARQEFRAAGPSIQGSVALFEVDADDQKGVAARFDIKAVPALLVFASGIEIAALIGFYSRDELLYRLRSIISNSG